MENQLSGTGTAGHIGHSTLKAIFTLDSYLSYKQNKYVIIS